MGKKDEWDDTSRYTPVSCAVCESCFFDKLRGHCVYGGPYSGYKQIWPSAGHAKR